MSTAQSSEFNTEAFRLESSSTQFNWTKLFWICLIVHCLAWFISSMLTMPTAPLDSVEKIALGLQWQWGYSKHPPLTHWLSALGFLISGSPKLPILLMSQLSVAACFIAIWQFTRRFLDAWASFVAVFCLEGIYYFTFATPQFNENIILLPLWSVCAICFYDGVTKQSLKAWIFAGILAGLACIAKYETVVFLLTLFAFICVNPFARSAWKDKGLYIALAICIAICIPNLIWLIQHNFLPIQYVLNKSNKTVHTSMMGQPLLDLLTQCATILPALLLLLPFYFLRRKSKSVSMHEQYLQFLALGPAAITFTMAILTGARIYALWGIPFFIWLGSWLMVKWDPVYHKKYVHLFFYFMLVIASAMVVGRSAQLLLGPSMNGRITYQHYPAKQLAQLAAEFWHEHASGPLPVIAGTSREVQSVVAYSKAPYPTAFIEWDDKGNAWTNSQAVQRKGAVFIYILHDSSMHDFPADIRTRFPRLGPAQTFSLPYQTKAPVPPLKVLMAILPESS